MPHAFSFFEALWHHYAPLGYLRLFSISHEGEAVAAHLVFTFGGRALSSFSGWSGQYGRLYPNEMLDWETITWAQNQGYQDYDFDGIDVRAAHAIRRGEGLPSDLAQTVTSFKLGFGGEICLLPDGYDTGCLPGMNWARDKLLPALSRWSFYNRLRTGRVRRSGRK